MAGELKPLIAQLLTRLKDTTLANEQRGQVVANLVGVHNLDGDIVRQVATLLGSSVSISLQQRTIDAFGKSGDRAAGDELIAAA